MQSLKITIIFFAIIVAYHYIHGQRSGRTAHVPNVRRNDKSYVYMRRVNTKKLLCSGALINLNHVITSARCVLSWNISLSTYSGRQRGYEVVAGNRAIVMEPPSAQDDKKIVKRNFFDIERQHNAKDVSIADGPEEGLNIQIQSITLITIEDKFNPASAFINDLAILEVRDSFFESAHVKPVRLNTDHSSVENTVVGTILTTFGFGKTPEGKRATVLTIQEIEVVEHVFCGYGANILKWMCFKEKYPAINMHDDPGDPIYFRNMLVGITSWASLVNRPGYFIAQNISAHQKYVLKKMSKIADEPMRENHAYYVKLNPYLALYLFPWRMYSDIFQCL